MVSSSFVVFTVAPASTSACTLLSTMARATEASAEMPLVLVPALAASACALRAAAFPALPSVGTACIALSRRAMGSLPATEMVSTSLRRRAKTSNEAAVRSRPAPSVARTSAVSRLSAKDAPTPTEVPGLLTVRILAMLPSTLSAEPLAVV